MTLGSTTEKQLTLSYTALRADQRTHELHTASVLQSLPLFMVVSKPHKWVGGLALQSWMRTRVLSSLPRKLDSFLPAGCSKGSLLTEHVLRFAA